MILVCIRDVDAWDIKVGERIEVIEQDIYNYYDWCVFDRVRIKNIEIPINRHEYLTNNFINLAEFRGERIDEIINK